MSDIGGHRERLRQRFFDDPSSFTEIEILELLLTYCIPRIDVRPHAHSLIQHYGTLQLVIHASSADLLLFDGIGEKTVNFINIIRKVIDMTKPESESPQLSLFPQDHSLPKKRSISNQKKGMRVFTNDEIKNSLLLLPKITNYSTLEDYKKFLADTLPYNSAETRSRRAQNIIERFFPDSWDESALYYYVSKYSTLEDLKPIIFYHVLKSEPFAKAIAEELIWPNLPIGKLARTQLDEFTKKIMPNISVNSIPKGITSVLHTYDLLGFGSIFEDQLRFKLHTGTLEAFLYIFSSEFPESGIFSFDDLFNGPLHRWLLWDKEWLRQQLYLLRSRDILSKVSEIDNINQFTIVNDQTTSLKLFFENSNE